MHIGVVALISTFFIYGALYDTKILFIYFGIIGIYTVINQLLPSKYNSTRRKIMIASWSGNINFRSL